MPDEFHNARNSIQRPEFLLGNRECIQESEPCRLHSLFDRQITPELAGKRQLPVSHGEDTGQEQKTSSLNSRNVRRQRFRGGGQLNLQFCESGLVRRAKRHPSPCAERIEKTLTHGKLIPLESFYDGMPQIGSRSSDAEMNPLRQLRSSGQEGDIFPCRELTRHCHIPSMIARQDKQVAWPKVFQEPGKPS